MALCYKKTGCLQHSRLTVGLHNKTVAIKDTAALIVTELNPVTVSLSTNTMGMIQTICDFISPTWTSFRFHMDFISYSGSTAADESGLRRKKGLSLVGQVQHCTVLGVLDCWGSD